MRDQNKAIVFNHNKVERTISIGGGFNHFLNFHSENEGRYPIIVVNIFQFR